MKVNGSSGAGAPVGSRNAARGSGEGFAPQAPAGSETAGPVSHAGPMAAVGSLEALLALQETASPLERRRRAVRRASRILDVLDDLRVATLDPSGLDGPILQKLAGAVQEARGETDDPRLNEILEEIEIRAAVEMTKREVRAAA